MTAPRHGAMSEILTDALSRLDLMRHDHGQTWDLSKNDEAAISAVLDSHAALRARVAELERVIAEAPHEEGCALNVWWHGPAQLIDDPKARYAEWEKKRPELCDCFKSKASVR